MKNKSKRKKKDKDNILVTEKTEIIQSLETNYNWHSQRDSKIHPAQMEKNLSFKRSHQGVRKCS